MTLRYVDGANGNDAWDGLAAIFAGGTNGPKATTNGAEDTPVAAGDLVHVRPTAYRETLTCDVSGTAGNPIEYRMDYAGLIWPNPSNTVGRITGSDNDQTAARANCVTANGKNYRTFTGFCFDLSSSTAVNCAGSGTNWIVQNCIINFSAGVGTLFTGTGGNHTVQNCVIYGLNSNGIGFTHTATVDNAGNTVQNCLIFGLNGRCISSTRIGGITIKNCNLGMGNSNGVRVDVALTAGQTVTVNNCQLHNLGTAMQATIAGELVENYNNFWANSTARTNVDTGANSTAYPPFYDPRWALQLLYAGAGQYSPLQVLSLFDLASYSPLVNLAGTSPTTTDLRGTAVVGAQREWGALEYDPTLKIFGGVKKSRIKAGF